MLKTLNSDDRPRPKRLDALMTVNIDPGTRMAQKQHMDAAKKYLGVE